MMEKGQKLKYIGEYFLGYSPFYKEMTFIENDKGLFNYLRVDYFNGNCNIRMTVKNTEVEILDMEKETKTLELTQKDIDLITEALNQVYQSSFTLLESKSILIDEKVRKDIIESANKFDDLRIEIEKQAK